VSPPAAAVATGKCNARHYKARLRVRSWDQSYYSAKPGKPPFSFLRPLCPMHVGFEDEQADR
jgi:hypothetical protein